MFASLIRSNYGEPTALKDFKINLTDHSKMAHNAKRICVAVSVIGITSNIKPKDIFESPQARDLLLFCEQLY